MTIAFTVEDAQMIIGFISIIIIPYLTSILKSKQYRKRTNALIAFAISGVLAALTLYSGGSLPPKQPLTIVALIAMLLGAAQLQYTLYFKQWVDPLFNPDPPKPTTQKLSDL